MKPVTIQETISLALPHHQAGRLREAEQLYQQVLAQQPGHVDALHLLGVINAQTGRYAAAVDLIRQAIALRPNFPEAYNNLGNALRDQGQLEQAIAAFRQALALKPDFPDAQFNLGNALKDQGQLEQAIAAYRQVLVLRPNFPGAYSNLGAALQAAGQTDQAIAACRQAIALNPRDPGAYSNLGNALRSKGDLDQAITACRTAIALKPAFPGAYNNLGVALKNQGQLAQAIAALRQAIALQPSYAEAYNNLGNALQDQGLTDQAIAAYRQAIALKPNYPEAYNNLGSAWQTTGNLDEAIAAYQQALSLRPDYAEAYGNRGIALQAKGHLDQAIAAFQHAITLKPTAAEAHHNLSLALLLHGDWPQGWEEYEWRWQVSGLGSSPRGFAAPPWDGRPLQGRTLLLHAEQGFGDTLQFIRYLPLVIQNGGKVIVECPVELRRLIQAMNAAIPVVAKGQALPDFDLHCPLMSLPKVLGTTLANVPHDVPYLQANATDTQTWRTRLAEQPAGVKVGLAWAGSRAHKNDRNRSLPLAALAPLAQVPGMHFYSLQKAATETAPPPGMKIIDLTAELQDFADTAALIANLDLVIAVDTAVAHLAGAMGKPVWTLLPFAPDWRWLLAREDSPWYPTMRLFRQPAIGDWDSVIQQVAQALAGWVQRG